MTRTLRRFSYGLCAILLAGCDQETSQAPDHDERASAVTNGLVAAYGFSEGTGTSTADASGNNLTGTLGAGASWSTAGKFGNAIQFNGAANSYVQVADANALHLTSAFTLSAWVKPTSLSGEPTVIFKHKTSPNDLTYALYAGASGVGPNTYVKKSGSYTDVSSSTALSTNTWAHLAATYDGSALKIYVNGILKNTVMVTAPIDSSTAVLRIGNNSVWSNEGFSGLIDEVRIYNRAESTPEIQADMVAAINGGGPDTTPPSGSISVNGGAAATNSTAATLTLSASDASGVTQMRLSNDGTNFGAAVSYATSAAWSLPSGDGNKTVYVQYKDTLGNWSGSFSDAITLDTVTPTLGSIAASSITSSSSAISWTTNEAASSYVDYGTMTSYGNASGNASVVASHSVALTGLSPATTYHYRVRSADAAGNQVTGSDFTFTTNAGSPGTSSLGTHVLLAQKEYYGRDPSTTAAITTHASGSTLLAFSAGWEENFADPTDTYGNTWSRLGTGKHLYAYQNLFYTGMWAVANASGGSGHTISVTKPGEYHNDGETDLALIEIANGGVIQDSVYTYAPTSDSYTQSPGSVTTTGPATLIAVWSGDGFSLDNTATPDNGFAVIDSFLNVGPYPDSGVQIAIAAKQVTQAGTYSLTWTSYPAQRAACYLIAVQH